MPASSLQPTGRGSTGDAGGLDWVSGKMSSAKERSGTGPGSGGVAVPGGAQSRV